MPTAKFFVAIVTQAVNKREKYSNNKRQYQLFHDTAVIIFLFYLFFLFQFPFVKLPFTVLTLEISLYSRQYAPSQCVYLELRNIPFFTDGRFRTYFPPSCLDSTFAYAVWRIFAFLFPFGS